jgi:hypothetical protein
MTDLSNYEPKIVEKMLRFMYQGYYDDEREMCHLEPSDASTTETELESPTSVSPTSVSEEPGQPSWKGEALVVNAKVFTIAEKYDFETLMEHAVGKYKEVLGDVWHTLGFGASIDLIHEAYEQYPSRFLRIHRIV